MYSYTCIYIYIYIHNIYIYVCIDAHPTPTLIVQASYFAPFPELEGLQQFSMIQSGDLQVESYPKAGMSILLGFRERRFKV